MNLSALIGNSRIKDQLSSRGQGRGLSHAYILSGPAGSGRHTLARLLAAGMLCTGAGQRPCGSCGPCSKVMRGIHPDVSLITGSQAGKPIAVDQVRALRADAYIRPNEGERKIYLLEEADQMNPSSQNAMLKLLEEGPPYAVFLLLVENPGGLLQTVCSRCETLALSPVTERECVTWLRTRFPDRPAQEIQQAAAQCQGILGRAVRILEDAASDQERQVLVNKLAAALEQGGELELLEAAMLLDGRGRREELSVLLDALERELGARAVRGGNRRRLLRAAELVRELKGAARLNVNGGQLSGWLCAGMFFRDQESVG